MCSVFLGGVTAEQARIAELEAIVETLRDLIERLEPLAEIVEAQRRLIVKLETRVAELERRLGQNSGNSGLPPSRDPAGERQRQAEQRAQQSSRTGGTKRRPGKQRGARGSGPAMSVTPDEIIDHHPDRCGHCRADLGEGTGTGFRARQVIEVPVAAPTVTERRTRLTEPAQRRLCQRSLRSPCWRPWGFPVSGHENSLGAARVFPGLGVLSWSGA